MLPNEFTIEGGDRGVMTGEAAMSREDDAGGESGVGWSGDGAARCLVGSSSSCQKPLADFLFLVFLVY